MLVASDCRRDALFVTGRAPRGNLMEVLTPIQDKRGCPAGQWRLISARRKMGRTLFEIEERSGRKLRRIVGKICRHERAEVLYRALRGLWMAGWKPPELYTVSRPLAFHPEKHLILQEKAPGQPALEAIVAGEEKAEAAGEACARWLVRLQSTKVPAPAAGEFSQAAGLRSRALQAILPSESSRIERVQARIEEVLSNHPATRVLSHGDFHGMNVLIHGDKRVTGIDLDKFSEKEPEADPAYFLAETAAQGFLQRGCFECTRAARSAFLKTYTANRGGSFHRARAGAWMAFTFLQHLHFELILLKTGHAKYVTPWMQAAETAAFDGNLELKGLPASS